MKKVDNRVYNRRYNRRLNTDMEIWLLIPDKLKEHFRMLNNGVWIVYVPGIYYISDTFPELRDAVKHYLAMDDEFNRSECVRDLHHKLSNIMR